MSITTCVVCVEPLVLPISYQCGHTVCKGCSWRLKRKLCPVCRRTIKRHGHVNTVLEDFLKKENSNYEAQAKELETALELERCHTMYLKSPRYNSRCMMMMNIINKKSYMKVTEIGDIMACSGQYTEIMYIADKCSTFIIYPPNVPVSEQYIILNRPIDVSRFLDEMKDLKERDVIYLISKASRSPYFVAYYGHDIPYNKEIRDNFTIFFTTLTPDDLDENTDCEDIALLSDTDYGDSDIDTEESESETE